MANKFYYLYPEKAVNKVYVEVVDFGTDETVFLQVVWDLYGEEHKQDIHYSWDIETLDEAFELLLETEDILKWYYRDKVKLGELEKVNFPIGYMDDLDDFSEEELMTDEEWEEANEFENDSRFPEYMNPHLDDFMKI